MHSDEQQVEEHEESSALTGPRRRATAVRCTFLWRFFSFFSLRRCSFSSRTSRSAALRSTTRTPDSMLPALHQEVKGSSGWRQQLALAAAGEQHCALDGGEAFRPALQ